jgi:hypothetical protein
MIRDLFYTFELPKVPPIFQHKEPSFNDLLVFYEKYKFEFDKCFIQWIQQMNHYYDKHKQIQIYIYTFISKEIPLTNQLLDKAIILRTNYYIHVLRDMESIHPSFVKSHHEKEMEYLISLLNKYYQKESRNQYDIVISELNYMPGGIGYYNAKESFENRMKNRL